MGDGREKRDGATAVPRREAIPEDFELGTPGLVCRWRLAKGRLPLENRHLRALGARGVGMGLVAWAKQHIEWTLKDGSAQNPDGVLMLVVDAQGRAPMTVGPYEPLPQDDAAFLRARAAGELGEKGVAPETLWGMSGGRLVAAIPEGAPLSGMASLVMDLAATRGIEVLRGSVDPAALDEVFLVSDEHGVVPASDAGGETGAWLARGYARLLERDL